MFGLSKLSLALTGAGLAVFVGLVALWRIEAGAADRLREDKSRFEALYEAETKTASAWKAFAEDRAKAAEAFARAEGAAATAETERQKALNWANAEIRRLKNATSPLPPECGSVIVRDADTNRLRNQVLDALADSAAAGDSAALPANP
jgi:hypothetical protein